MATEEIEISELEFTEDLGADNLIPIESATETKATSLQIFKNWLLNFFVGKTGDETISGVKTFLNNPILNSSTKNMVAILNENKQLVSDGNISTTELGYLNGVTSSIQTQLNNKITSNINKVANGYCKFSSGLIVQWGQIAGNSNTRHTVTLPTAFTSTNYTVCSSNTTYADSAPWGATIEQITTTTFKIFQVHKQKIWWVAIGY